MGLLADATSSPTVSTVNAWLPCPPLRCLLVERARLLLWPLKNSCAPPCACVLPRCQAIGGTAILLGGAYGFFALRAIEQTGDERELEPK